jgi:hypothetical protein
MSPTAPSSVRFLVDPLAVIRGFRHNRLVALWALLALLFAGTAYVVHGFDSEKPLSQHSATHCDLCLHFSGTAGAPDHPAIVGNPPTPSVAPDAVETPRYSSYEHPTNRLPRAPPALT